MWETGARMEGRKDGTVMVNIVLEIIVKKSYYLFNILNNYHNEKHKTFRKSKSKLPSNFIQVRQSFYLCKDFHIE